jgi:hypothetical protein
MQTPLYVVPGSSLIVRSLPALGPVLLFDYPFNQHHIQTVKDIPFKHSLAVIPMAVCFSLATVLFIYWVVCFWMLQ